MLRHHPQDPRGGLTVLPSRKRLAQGRRPRLAPALVAGAALLAAGTGAALPSLVATAATGPTAVTVVNRDQGGAASTLRSGSLMTSGPQLLVALLASDSGGPGAKFSGVTGCGLTWTRAAVANGQSGLAEIWTAKAPAALNGCTLSATRGFGSWAGSLTVAGFTGASGTGAVATRSAATGTPTVSLPPPPRGPAVSAGGVDWDTPLSRPPGTGTALIHQSLPPVGAPYWFPKAPPATTAGTPTTLTTL